MPWSAKGALKTHVHPASAKESDSETYWDDTVTPWHCGVPVPKGTLRIARNYYQHLLINLFSR